MCKVPQLLDPFGHCESQKKAKNARSHRSHERFDARDFLSFHSTLCIVNNLSHPMYLCYSTRRVFRLFKLKCQKSVRTKKFLAMGKEKEEKKDKKDKRKVGSIRGKSFADKMRKGVKFQTATSKRQTFENCFSGEQLFSFSVLYKPYSPFLTNRERCSCLAFREEVLFQ